MTDGIQLPEAGKAVIYLDGVVEWCIKNINEYISRINGTISRNNLGECCI